MSEAWFMSGDENRRRFPELCGDLQGLSVDQLQRVLTEIATGPGAFGQHEEWTDWYHYLLPRLLRRAHETYVDPLLELLLTAFFAQHPDGLAIEPYAGFRDDVLATLGSSLMQGACWPGGQLDVGVCLNKHFNRHLGSWEWYRASGKLSGSMFFCLKYLSKDDIAPWLKTVFAIDDRYWRAQLIVWLVGAHGFLTGDVHQPAELSLDRFPRVDWDWSHCLSGNYAGSFRGDEPESEFIPVDNRRAALAAVKRVVSAGETLSRLDEISLDASLAGEVDQLQDRVFDLYRE